MQNRWMDRVSDYVDGEMDLGERELFEGRLQEDPDLRRAVDEVQDLVTRAASLGPIEPPEDLWEGIEERIRGRVERARAPQSPAPRPNWTRRLTLVAAGIVVMILSGSAGWWLHGLDTPTPTDLAQIEGPELEAPVADGDQISVYPVFESLDVSPLLRLRPYPLRRSRFFADAQLGRLARYLRLLGFDTRYVNGIDDALLVARAAAEQRIILTRDRQLLMRREVTHGCHIREDQPLRQLRYVIRRCDLVAAARPFTLCMECNGRLVEVAKSDIVDRLEPATRESFDKFWRCETCRRIYWRGSHYVRLSALVDAVLEATD